MKIDAAIIEQCEVGKGPVFEPRRRQSEVVFAFVAQLVVAFPSYAPFLLFKFISDNHDDG